jgi:hypothetical protein
MKRRPAMQKISTKRTSGKNIFEGQLTIGLDLGDRSSSYCVLNEAGEIVLEHRLATTPEAIKQAFGSMPRSRIAMETGTHSPWVSRLLTELGHEVIVGHAQKVRLITKSRRIPNLDQWAVWNNACHSRKNSSGAARLADDAARPGGIGSTLGTGR